ncbi:cupredoxin domain-containing protein [Sphingosinicella sp. CPCC 101087]|uniref:cupredoxin domain-containing protein n=1 Tax=Sphingosinicella sp. CPCC 101087 TaxID=2497754 RepID=UPI00101BEAA9|nr:cupredoxin domain-containing protein [Sphingosinicella sp. CPCC 101087]
MRPVLLLLALLLAGPAAAQQPEWRAAREYEVLMRPFAFEPKTIRLEAGRPVRLRFLNQGQATYSFSAGDFFRAAHVRARDAELIADGHLQVAPGEQKVIALVPAAGRYRARSGNFLHRLLGMSAEIVVQ